MKKIEKLLEQKSKKELINIIMTERNKKYGLVWDREYEREKVVLKCIDNFPVFSEIPKYRIKGKDCNYLIEGDNYHSLMTLSYTHKEMVDIIYIDPPYNTGNKDFLYNDNFVDSEDGYRHSKWLNFMEKRLQLAHGLLNDKGMMFISIDDNELFQLKMLCDSIFGEKNYINTISVNAKSGAGASGGGEDKKLKKNIEYILFYCKDINQIEKINTLYKETELMTYINQMKENKKSFKYTSVLYEMNDVEYFNTIKDGSGEDIVISKVNKYAIKSVKQVAELEGTSEEEVYNKYYNKIMTTTNAQTSIRTRVWKSTDSKNTMYIASYVPKTGKYKGKKVEKIFMGKQKVLVIWLKDTSVKIKNKIYKKEKIGTYWDGFSWINVTKEGNTKFDNGKKPIKLIKQLISLNSNKNSLVMDFFAGSGSTGHAVWELNKEDKGKRTFILCQNKEKSNIALEKTYSRLKKCVNDEGLVYLKSDFVELEKDKDDMKMKSVRKLNTSIMTKENAFDIILETQYYTVVGSNKKVILIYNWFFDEKVKETADEINKLKAKVDKIYYFDSISIYESLVKAFGESIVYNEIPSEIINEYYKIKETII